MIVPVTTSDLTCWSDCVRHHYGTIALLSIFGPTNAVRAVWARLIEGRWGSITIPGVDANLSAAKEVSYGKAQQLLEPDVSHLVMYDRRLTVVGSAWEPRFLHAAPSADAARKTWFDRFSRRCRVPMRPSWGETMWDKGLAAEAIWPLDGVGAPCYQIDIEPETWLPIVKEALTAGEVA